MFREELAVLLMYDGEPRYSEIENSPYERVLNVPMAVVRKTNSSEHWLTSGKVILGKGRGVSSGFEKFPGSLIF